MPEPSLTPQVLLKLDQHVQDLEGYLHQKDYETIPRSQYQRVGRYYKRLISDYQSLCPVDGQTAPSLMNDFRCKLDYLNQLHHVFVCAE